VSAKVVWYREAWWLRVHANGRKRDRRFGPTKAAKRDAERVAVKVNAALALGQYGLDAPKEQALPCNEQLRGWLTTYEPTMKPGYAKLTRGLIENHLVPYFGSRDLREIREVDLLRFIKAKLDAGLSPTTIRNSLSALRRGPATGVPVGVNGRGADMRRFPA
jgi:hypothetical protein